MENCIFCKIIKGGIKASIVYQDDATLAFLDIHPIHPGHILVIPKTHMDQFFDLSQDQYLKVMTVVKRLSQVVDKSIKPKRVGLLVAGWDVPHVHIHIVPMDNLHDLTSQAILEGTRGNPSEEELKLMVEKIKGELG